MIAVNILCTIGLLLLVPMILGYSFMRLLQIKHLNLGSSVVFGMVVQWAAFLIVAIPLIALQATFSMLVIVYSSVLGVLTVAGLVYMILLLIKKKFEVEFWLKGDVFYYLVIAFVVLLVVAQLFLQHFDADDAEYVAIATTTIHTNSLLKFDAFTGHFAMNTLAKRIVSPYSIWTAYCSKIVGFHPAIFCHTVLPVLMVLYTYWLYRHFAHLLFEGNEKKVSKFLAALYLMILFGGYSTFTISTRLLFRGGQGKSVLACIGIPFLFAMAYNFSEAKLKWRGWVTLFVTVLAGNLLSSMSNILILMVVGALAICQGIRHRSLAEFFKWLTLIIPCLLFIVAYMFL